MRLQSTPVRYRLAAALYLFLVYAVGVFSKSAWSDDYSSLLDPKASAIHIIRDGRPIYGEVLQFVFEYFNNVQSLVFIRLIGVIGLILLNDLLIKNLLARRFDVGVVVASCVAFTLPSFQFSAHWAQAFGPIWAPYLAVLGYTLTLCSSKLKRILGLLLFVISLLIYPLLSFFVFPYIYAVWFVEDLPFAALFKNLRAGFFLIASSSVISFVVSYTYLRLNGLEFNDRVGIITFGTIPTKLVFFLTRPFATTYRPFFIDSPTAISLLLEFSFFFVAVALLLWRKFGVLSSVILHLIVLNLFFILSLLPLLVTTENQIDMRLVCSNTWLFCFVVVSLLLKPKAASLGIRELSKNRFRFFMMAFLLTLGFYSINQNFQILFHNPYQTKQAFFEKQFESCTASQIKSGVVITRRTLPWPHKNLIGAYSQSTDFESDWVPVGAVVQFLKDASLVSDSLPILGVPGENLSACEINLDEY